MNKKHGVTLVGEFCLPLKTENEGDQMGRLFHMDLDIVLQDLGFHGEVQVGVQVPNTFS